MDQNNLYSFIDPRHWWPVGGGGRTVWAQRSEGKWECPKGKCHHLGKCWCLLETTCGRNKLGWGSHRCPCDPLGQKLGLWCAVASAVSNRQRPRRPLNSYFEVEATSSNRILFWSQETCSQWVHTRMLEIKQKHFSRLILVPTEPFNQNARKPLLIEIWSSYAHSFHDQCTQSRISWQAMSETRQNVSRLRGMNTEPETLMSILEKE